MERIREHQKEPRCFFVDPVRARGSVPRGSERGSEEWQSACEGGVQDKGDQMFLLTWDNKNKLKLPFVFTVLTQ